MLLNNNTFLRGEVISCRKEMIEIGELLRLDVIRQSDTCCCLIFFRFLFRMALVYRQPVDLGEVLS